MAPTFPIAAAFDLLLRDEAFLPNTTDSLSSSNSTATGIEVICAYPVSGQYGPGARMLYYTLVAACVLARHVHWVREACLAGALILPLVAGVHGIVLASFHVVGAVDMDIYGVFQFCVIGVLAAPVTVRMSRTYNAHRGRNIIFVWSTLICAGLIGIAIEFYRSDPTLCLRDDNGNPLSSDPNAFLNSNATCGIPCSVDSGPFSPLRTGSANNIYLIPAPTLLPFHPAMLLSVGAGIPALVFLMAMLLKASDRSLGEEPSPEISPAGERPVMVENGPSDSMDDAANNHESYITDVESTTTTGGLPPAVNGGKHRRRRIRKILKSLQRNPEVLPFMVFVFAILVVGERNFWSPEVYYQTEYMSNVGQWAPLAATLFAILGSIYMLLAEAISQEQEDRQEPPNDHPPPHRPRRNLLQPLAHILVLLDERITDWNSRTWSSFRTGHATGFPEVPGEELRNGDLSKWRTSWQDPAAAAAADVAETERQIALHGASITPIARSRSHSLRYQQQQPGSATTARSSRGSLSQQQYSKTPRDSVFEDLRRSDTLTVPGAAARRDSSTLTTSPRSSSDGVMTTPVEGNPGGPASPGSPRQSAGHVSRLGRVRSPTIVVSSEDDNGSSDDHGDKAPVGRVYVPGSDPAGGDGKT